MQDPFPNDLPVGDHREVQDDIEASPAAALPIGLEFYLTAKGAQRAKLGPVEQVPGPTDGVVPKVVSPVLVSEQYTESTALRADLDRTLAAVAAGELVVIGSDYVPPAWVPENELAAIAAESMDGGAPAATPEHLEGFGGVPIDRRQLGVLLGLDRKFEHFVETPARRIWLHLYDGKSLPEAVEMANKLGAGGSHPQLSFREGFELAQREAYRLALYIVLVQNRDIGPPSSRLG